MVMRMYCVVSLVSECSSGSTSRFLNGGSTQPLQRVRDNLARIQVQVRFWGGRRRKKDELLPLAYRSCRCRDARIGSAFLGTIIPGTAWPAEQLRTREPAITSLIPFSVDFPVAARPRFFFSFLSLGTYTQELTRTTA